MCIRDSAIIIKSLELIDMRKHSGNHPRMGAVDVCPFVPLTADSMSYCIQSAKDLSELMGEKIPHFFYGEAASSEERISKSLPSLIFGTHSIRTLFIKTPNRTNDQGHYFVPLFFSYLWMKSHP